MVFHLEGGEPIPAPLPVLSQAMGGEEGAGDAADECAGRSRVLRTIQFHIVVHAVQMDDLLRIREEYRGGGRLDA